MAEQYERQNEEFIFHTTEIVLDRYEELRRYMNDFCQYPVLCGADFNKLHQEWKKNQNREAYDLMVYSNARLVISTARRYVRGGLGVLDIVQEGFLGLMTAVEKFEPELGHQFSTYAHWWIQQSIQRALVDLNEVRPYRVPVHMSDKLFIVRRDLNGYYITNEHLPNPQELFAWIHRFDGTEQETPGRKNLSFSDTQKCLLLLLESYRSLEQPFSINEHNNKGNKVVMFDEVLGDVGMDTEVVVEARTMLAEYRGALERIGLAMDNLLKPREASIFRLRLGFEFECMTLEEVAKLFNLTRERIRQILVKVNEKLRGELGIGEEEIEKIVSTIDKLKKIACAEEKPGDLESIKIEPCPVIEYASLDNFFNLLCEHLILLPSGMRIVKAPLRVLKIRAKITSQTGKIILDKLQERNLIQECKPLWDELSVVPEVPIPVFEAYKSHGKVEVKKEVENDNKVNPVPKKPVVVPASDIVTVEVIPPKDIPVVTTVAISSFQNMLMETAIVWIEKQLPELRMQMEVVQQKLSKMESSLTTLRMVRDNRQMDVAVFDEALRIAEAITTELFSQMRATIKQS